jgi:hypothetical protein
VLLLLLLLLLALLFVVGAATIPRVEIAFVVGSTRVDNIRERRTSSSSPLYFS